MKPIQNKFVLTSALLGTVSGRFAPKVHDPICTLSPFQLRTEALTAQQLNQRRRQKRRNHDEPFPRLNFIRALLDFRQRLVPTTNQFAHINSLKIGYGWHKFTGRIEPFAGSGLLT